MTAEELLALPDGSGWRYEVVEGVLVRVAGSGQEATTIGGIIFGMLFAYVFPRRLGILTPADGEYTFPGAETGLLPDIGFYVAKRQALIEDRTKPIPFAPDLAVQVASPIQHKNERGAKAALYLRGGTRLIWIVWPQYQHIDIWRDEGIAPAVTLLPSDTLSGEEVVPGFALRVSDVFADPLG